MKANVALDARKYLDAHYEWAIWEMAEDINLSLTSSLLLHTLSGSQTALAA